VCVCVFTQMAQCCRHCLDLLSAHSTTAGLSTASKVLEMRDNLAKHIVRNNYNLNSSPL